MERRGWLTQSLILVAELVLLAGCQGDSSPLAANAASAPSNRPGEVAPVFPVRVPRAFFADDVRGTLTITGCGATLASLDGPIDFTEGDPIGPPPEPGALADFRDRPGDATFAGSGGVGLEFIVSPDVSSMAVSAQRTTPLGISGFVESKLGLAAGAAKDIAFVEASVRPPTGPTELDVSYTINASTPSCAGPLAARLQLSR